jgi:hypothetical protein
MTDLDRRATARGRPKATPGVFALRCMPTRQVWVDAAVNLEAARNGLWFFLGHGLHRDAALQLAWRTHGESAFRYEVLETVEPEHTAPPAPDVLQRKKEEWTVKLKALGIRS